MSNERQDEFFSWRSRLGPPDALPEQGLDNRDQAWERLAPRLGGAPPEGNSTRRHVIGYWIAAACLLPALILIARFFHDRSTQTVHQPDAVTFRPPARAASYPPAPAPPGQSSPPAQSTPATLPPTEGSRILQSEPRPILPSRHAPKELAWLPKPAGKPPSSGHLPSPVMKLAALTPDSAALISRPDPSPETALNPLQQQNPLKTRQLRIVHINDLDNSSQPQPATTSIHYREPDIKAMIPLKNH